MNQRTAQGELASIRSLMAGSQAFLSGTWQHQLLWGTLAAIGLGATWVAARAVSIYSGALEPSSLPGVLALVLLLEVVPALVLRNRERAGAARS
jgi:hypothetical protein